MARREFSAKTKREALKRSGYVCEGILPNGVRCPAKVGKGNPVEFDHILSDWMGGEPTLENCAALCKNCHKFKTALDAAARAQANRRFDRHNGITDPNRRQLVSRGLPKAPPQHRATKALGKDLPPRNSLYISNLEPSA